MSIDKNENLKSACLDGTDKDLSYSATRSVFSPCLIDLQLQQKHPSPGPVPVFVSGDRLAQPLHCLPVSTMSQPWPT